MPLSELLTACRGGSEYARENDEARRAGQAMDGRIPPVIGCVAHADVPNVLCCMPVFPKHSQSRVRHIGIQQKLHAAPGSG